MLAAEAEKEKNLLNEYKDNEMARKIQRISDMKEMGIEVGQQEMTDDESDDSDDVVGLIQLRARNAGEMATSHTIEKAILEKRKAELLSQL